MKRAIYKELLEWKKSPRRKPLILKGARQTGKTYILNEFARQEYNEYFYFNFEEDPHLKEFFKDSIVPKKIIENLSLYKKKNIEKENTLIIFDEIQLSNDALNSLKYFCEQANDYHIAAAGSLIGIKLSSPKSFPVGKVNFLELFPMTFYEFLDAIEETKYKLYLEELAEIKPIPEPFHIELLEFLKKYHYVGGMPEAVEHYAKTRDLLEIRKIHNEILQSYELDFSKHAPHADLPKISLIWNSIPEQLARENKKFIFSAVKKSARAREYESALSWLENAGLLYKTVLVESGKMPLKFHSERNSFKIYLLDVGLLGALAKISVDVLVHDTKVFSAYGGALMENYVAQQLKSLGLDLYYWKRESAKAEIDFLFEMNNRAYPLEVKSGKNVRSKSLSSYGEKYHPPLLFRTTPLNLKQDGKICNISLYAISSLLDVTSIATSVKNFQTNV